MAKGSLTGITTSQTFQNWFDKTNELVTLFQSDTLTASGGSGDITTGNATLAGTFTGSNIIVAAAGKLETDEIATTTPGAAVDFTSAILVTGTSAVCATMSYGSGGGLIRYSDGSVNWDAGLVDSTYQINTGSGGQFSLTSTGNLALAGGITSVGDITSTGTISADTIDATNITGLTFDTSTVAEADDATYSSETQYFSRARAQAAFVEGEGVTFAASANNTVSISANYTEIATGISLSNYALSSALGSYLLSATAASTYYKEDSALSARSYFVKSDGAGFSSTADMVAYEFCPRGAYADTNNYFRMYGSGSAGTPTMNFGIVQSGATSRKMYIAANLTITCDTYAIGDIKVYANGSTETITLDASSGNINATGSITADGDITAYNSASDIRLKDNIQIIPDALDKVSRINGYTFNYKNKPNEPQTGLIAQEVEKILPGLVYDYDENEETGEVYKAIRYGNTIGLLVEAIKELTEKVNKLEENCSCKGGQNS